MHSISNPLAGLSFSRLVAPSFKPFLATLLLGISFSVQAIESVTDVSGRTVQVPAKAERIVLGFGVFPAFAAVEGLQTFARVAAMGPDLGSRSPQVYEAMLQRFPQLKDIPVTATGEAGKGATVEEILALKPDAAIFGGGGDGPVNVKPGSLQARLIAAGVPVIYVDFRSHPGKNTVPSIKAIAKLIGREQQGEQFVRFHEAQLQRVSTVLASIPSSQRPRVFLDMRAGGIAECCGTPGDGNYGDLIEAAGAVNVGASLHKGVLGSAKPEAIAAARPDIYVAGGASSSESAVGVRLGDRISTQQARSSLQQLVAQRVGVTTLPAVQGGQVYGVWHNFYNHPFNVVAIQALAKIAYPDHFADLDPNVTMREMYRQFLHLDLDGSYWVSLTDTR